MGMKCKVRVYSVTNYGSHQDAVVMHPVTDDGIPEHERYYQATPSGTIELSITNPELVGTIKPGQLYYVKFQGAARDA